MRHRRRSIASTNEKRTRLPNDPVSLGTRFDGHDELLFLLLLFGTRTRLGCHKIRISEWSGVESSRGNSSPREQALISTRRVQSIERRALANKSQLGRISRIKRSPVGLDNLRSIQRKKICFSSAVEARNQPQDRAHPYWACSRQLLTAGACR